MNEHRDLWWKSPTVKLARVACLDLDTPFTATHGGVLEEIQVSYESWGELDANGENTVLLAHALTSDCHATGAFARQPLGWWESLIGPGRPIDTDKFFVVCPNLIGGCYGTTGPHFPGPDGEPYLQRFPLLTPLDMMRVQRLFLRTLGIEKIAMVIGPSMGGMVAWEWAIEGGDDVGMAVIVAAPLSTGAYQIGLNWLQRRGIELDLKDDEAMAKWGQMVARGVGMLSYRAPVGLDAKFGREWFQKPGPTLGERGMYNIESWLRHHGMRSAKRFDPYTYILFSRAMDLHDVGAERGGFLEALDRVRCRTVIIGVSSDDLYNPVDVHQGADILNHLGKPVEYAEIRSPHGHDAVFIETGQIGDFLRGLDKPATGAVPSAARREARLIRIGMIGAGRVAPRFLRLLEERRERLRDAYGLRFSVVAAADTDRSKIPGSEFDGIEFGHDPEKMVDREDVDVLIELTSGTGAHGLIVRALRNRKPVVTPNKALIREHGEALEALALEQGVRLAYRNAVAAGWPLLYAVERPLGGMVIASIEAMVSSTCNIFLERLEAGDSREEALRNAVDRGLTEFDPEFDLSGWDSAQKMTILITRAKRRRYSVGDLAVTGVDAIPDILPALAPPLGLRVKLAGLYHETENGPVAGILPLAVPLKSHLGEVRGENNAVLLRSAEMGEMVYIGKGGGNLPVATAVLNDLIGLYHGSRSWAGRYPKSPERTNAPRFDRFLAIREGEAVVTGNAGEGAVPLLESLIDE